MEYDIYVMCIKTLQSRGTCGSSRENESTRRRTQTAAMNFPQSCHSRHGLGRQHATSSTALQSLHWCAEDEAFRWDGSSVLVEGEWPCRSPRIPKPTGAPPPVVQCPQGAFVAQQHLCSPCCQLWPTASVGAWSWSRAAATCTRRGLAAHNPRSHVDVQAAATVDGEPAPRKNQCSQDAQTQGMAQRERGFALRELHCCI